MQLAHARGIGGAEERQPVSRWALASDGVNIHALDWSGAGTPVILIHGGRLNAHTFDLLALALGEGQRSIALDLRGHGESDWADVYRVEQMAADVSVVANQLQLDRFHLVGMSLGGCVAGHAAAILGNRIASLAFLDVGPKVNFETTSRMRAFLAGVKPAPAIEDVVRAAMAVSPRTDPDLMRYRYETLLARSDAGYFWKADTRHPPDFGHILGKLAELDELAPTIRCPVLVIKGGRSEVLDSEAAFAFAARFPRGKVAILEEAGHNLQEDAPIALAAALTDLFMRSRS